MVQRILIIGSEGFIGRSFLKHKTNQNLSLQNHYLIDIHNVRKENYFKCNATDFDLLNSIIKKINPTEIYNFSGSFTNNYEEDYTNNVIVSKNVFESILSNNLLDCKILINGSAAEYGTIKEDENPIDESNQLYPISFYGLSKIYQTYLARLYYLSRNLKIYIARPFNVMGFGISTKLFIGRLINQMITHLENKSDIELGNIENERDYIDIEDLIYAYDVIMKKGEPGVCYNIGRGEALKIGDLLEKFLNAFEIEKRYIKINKSFVKKFDVSRIVANISKLRKLNWNPKISIEKSIQKIRNAIFNQI